MLHNILIVINIHNIFVHAIGCVKYFKFSLKIIYLYLFFLFKILIFNSIEPVK